MRLFVYSLRVGLHFSLDGFLELQWLALKFSGDLLADLQVLSLVEREERASPFPLQFSLAFVLGLVEEAAGAGLVIDY